MSGQHGGNFNPNNLDNYHGSSVPRPAAAHGGNYNPNHPSSHSSSPVARRPLHQPCGDHYTPNDPVTYQTCPPGSSHSASESYRSLPHAPSHQPNTSFANAPPPGVVAQFGFQGIPQSRTNSAAYALPVNYQSHGNNSHRVNHYNEISPAPVQHSATPSRRGVLVKNPATAIAEKRRSVQEPKESKEIPTKLKGTAHIWRKPHGFQKPGFAYADSGTEHRHRDAADRIKRYTAGDKYLHPNTGHLEQLIVMAADELLEVPANTTWIRRYIQKVAPLKVRAASWVVDYGEDPDSWEDWLVMLLRVFPAAIVSSLCFWDISKGIQQFKGHYEPVNYRYHGDAKVWANGHEDRNRSSSSLTSNSQTYRLLRPRDLCFLRRTTGVDIMSVKRWERENGENADLRYLFVAYSSLHFSHDNEGDMRMLHNIAEWAARREGIGAYWVACSCMRHEEKMESDVYRISDVVRGAHKMIIALPPSNRTQSDLLKEWGSRMWTFPEVLLSPGDSVSLYTLESLENSTPVEVHKNQFAARAWPKDADVSRLLTDHYLGNTQLSRLELAVFGLKCLWSRQTSAYLEGDQAYALMGLLRARPKIERSDSAFQAFARLSLANDSDRLLERLVCTLPKSQTQPWHDMSDAYGSALWDISPTIQLAGICSNDTVVIDSAFGAAIKWDCFMRPWQSTGPSFKRSAAQVIMENHTWFLVAGAVLIYVGGRDRNLNLTFVGVAFLVIFLSSWIMTPKLVRTIHGGKFREIQAMLFGFEGYVNKAGIERAIFGANFGRLVWSPNGSPLSRSVLNKFGERTGVDPIASDPAVRRKVEQARDARPGQMRVFTLVDTYNMEVMVFEAARPPVALFLCGGEGGMQRAVGCSYEWTTGTFVRETVLRMQTTTLNRMDRVPRFRFGMKGEESRLVAKAPA